MECQVPIGKSSLSLSLSYVCLYAYIYTNICIYEYKLTLENMGLNCTDPFTLRLFFIKKYYSITRPTVVEFTNRTPDRSNYKVILELVFYFMRGQRISNSSVLHQLFIYLSS